MGPGRGRGRSVGERGVGVKRPAAWGGEGRIRAGGADQGWSGPGLERIRVGADQGWSGSGLERTRVGADQGWSGPGLERTRVGVWR